MDEKIIVGSAESIAAMIEKKSNCHVKLIHYTVVLYKREEESERSRVAKEKHCDILLVPAGLRGSASLLQSARLIISKTRSVINSQAAFTC